MNNIKLAVVALPAIGKTTLLQTLTDTLVIARDGKRYPFAQPHINVPDYTSVSELIDIIANTVEKYEDKFGKLPKTVAIDSISKILLDIEGYCLATIKSFPYGKINTEIKEFVDFIERDLAEVFNIVLVSHALYNEDTVGYSLVNAGGSYGKKGGILSEVDESVFLELKGKKRIIHYRNPKMCARTTVGDLPDSIEAPEFNLQDHLTMLQNKQSKAAEWSL